MRLVGNPPPSGGGEVNARHNSPDTLLYVDPPYVRQTRTQDVYAAELSDDEHRRLLKALVAHRGSVVLSGYANDLYDEMLADWQRYEIAAPKVERGAKRCEVLWCKQKSRG